MSPGKTSESTWQKWLPFIAAMVLQAVTLITVFVRLSDQTAQNAKDIAELRLIVVPRPEIKQSQDDVKETLRDIQSKLDILLNRPTTIKP